MEYFDMRKMSVNLWRNAAGETREICTFPPAKRDFYWRASIASIAANGEFSLFPGMERIVTLLEGGEMLLESADRFNHTLKPLQPFAFAADRGKSETDGRADVDGFQHHDTPDVCKAKVRIAERTFTTFGSRGGVVFVINGAWQLGDKLLTTDRGACWFDGRHTLRLYNRKVNCCSVKSTGSLVIRRIKFSNFIVTGKQRLTKNFITVVIKPGGCPN